MSLTTPVGMIPDLNTNIENAQVGQGTEMEHDNLFPSNARSFTTWLRRTFIPGSMNVIYSQ